MIHTLEEDIDKCDIENMLNGKYDQYSCMLVITCGLGGADAQDWTTILSRMYQRYAERKGFTVTILDESYGDHGLKSVDMRIDGMLAYGYLAKEKGTHRLVRISPFNAQGKRQTSFAGVETWPALDDEEVPDMQINDKVKTIFLPLLLLLRLCLK